MNLDPEPDLPEVERAAREWLAQLEENYFQRFNPPYHADLMVRPLLTEVDQLRKELQEQWEMNHAEHCTWEPDDCKGFFSTGCNWPRPATLKCSQEGHRIPGDDGANPEESQ